MKGYEPEDVCDTCIYVDRRVTEYPCLYCKHMNSNISYYRRR